jgi:hypothetical protein
MTRKGLVKKLDTVFSKVVREREKACVTCGSRERLTCGHLFSRQNYSTRWDLDNGHTQCWGCNYKHEFEWEPYRRWFVETYGQEEYDDLYQRHTQVKKFKDYELEEMITKYKELLKEAK